VLLGEFPTMDFGLVVLRRALNLPRGSALVLFALGRTVGWIAHAMEQYAVHSLIRPRAAYTGPSPISPEP
jgi:citrate synthase